MGKGRDIARGSDPQAALHAQVLADFMDQLMIVCMKRLADKNGCVVIPVAEVDATGSSILSFSVTDGNFNFVVSAKQ